MTAILTRPVDVPVVVRQVHLTRHVRVLCDCGGHDDYQPGLMAGPAYRSHNPGCGHRTTAADTTPTPAADVDVDGVTR